MVDLVIRQHVSTADPAVAGAAFGELIGSGDLTAGADFNYEQRSLVDDGVSVARISSRGDRVEVTSRGSADLVLVGVRAGGVRLACRGEVVAIGRRELAVIPFNEACTLRWSSADIDVFSFPLSSFIRTLGNPGRELTVRAPYLTSRSPELTNFWFQLADLVTRQVLDRAEVYANDVVRAQVVDGLAAVTVEAFRLTNQQEHERIRDDQLVNQVDTFIQTHLQEPISISEIAADAGISVRGLQVVFQRRVGRTPVAHLRRKRLEAARVALLNPAPDSTVGDIGRRVGYSNLGRFSAHYRDEFDEIPSRTLERSRPRT